MKRSIESAEQVCGWATFAIEASRIDPHTLPSSCVANVVECVALDNMVAPPTNQHASLTVEECIVDHEIS